MSRDTSLLKVLVVDDSAYNRKMIRGMLQDMPAVGKVETAGDGQEAIKKVLESPPDVITLDLNMPQMDGFTFLRWMVKNRPLPVLVVSSEGGEKNVFKALDLGALEFVVKPSRHPTERIVEIRQELQEKVRAIAGRDLTSFLRHLEKKRPAQPEDAEEGLAGPSPEGRFAPVAPEGSRGAQARGILVIGASTGGPSAIQGVLAALPGDFGLPIVVVQHMPPVFTRQFAQRLGKTTSFPSQEAVDGDRLVPGRVLVVPGGYHLEISGETSPRAYLRERGPSDRFVPSVDVTMLTAARVFGRKALGVLLTGMGDDGALGLLAIREAGGKTIAESQESAVVWGMPRAAIQRGAALHILSLEDVPEEIVEMAQEMSGLEKSQKR